MGSGHVHRRGLISAGLAALPLLACSEPVPVQEVVLRPGESVTATNKFGTVRVTYVSPLERKFEFDGLTKVAKLIPRPERFEGMLGLYDPADAWAFAPPKFRLLVEEAERHFDSYDQIYAALYEGSDVLDWVYTGDGLVVGFERMLGTHPGEIDTYWVSVFQYLLRGAKPSGLRGARDRAIRLVRV